MSEVSGTQPAEMHVQAPSTYGNADRSEPSTDDLVAAAIRMARGAGLSWVHINQVLAGRP